MKKLFFAIVLCVIAITVAFSLVACRDNSDKTPPQADAPAGGDDQGSSGDTGEHVHTYGEWVVTVAPSCTQNGVRIATCTRCSDTLTETVPALGHERGTNDKCIRCGENLGTIGLQYDVQETFAVVTSYTGGETEVNIPSIHAGVPVTTIGDYAFYNQTSLTSITIPDSIASIGIAAFRGCSGLRFNSYDNALYLGNETNPYLVLAQATSHTIGQCEIHPKTHIIYYLAFEDCNRLTSIVIPQSVTSIGIGAFFGCENIAEIRYPSSMADWCAISGLKHLMDDHNSDKSLYLDGTLIEGDLIIPDDVTTIGDGAFEGCALTSVTLGDGVIGIGDYAFYHCSELNSVTIGNGVRSIGEHAFGRCKKLTAITIPDGVASIGGYAFSDCDELSSVTIGSNVRTIGVEAFVGCKKIEEIRYSGDAAGWCEISGLLTLMSNGHYGKCLYINGSSVDGELVIPDSATIVADHAFYNVSRLTSIVIPDGVTSIGNQAFFNGWGLASCSIGSGVTSIGDEAFYACDKLTSVAIPDNVTNIGSKAFRNCRELTSVAVGSGVTDIGDEAFQGCGRLVEVYNKSALPLTKGSDSYGGVAYSALNVYTQADGSKLSLDKDGYLRYTDEDEVRLIRYYGTAAVLSIPNDIHYIHHGAFAFCMETTDVTIHSSVIGVDEHAFASGGLRSVTIDEGATIGENAFAYCSSLKSITADADNASKIAKHCGSSSYAVTITSGSSIAGSAFSDCSGLSAVSIGQGVTAIGNYAFRNCSGLTSVLLPDSVTSIGRYAFGGCRALTSISIPDGVTSIEEGTFSACAELAAITLPERLTSIGNNAFEGCGKLTSITIPEDVTSIGGGAFTSCSGLTAITVPDKVTSIGDRTFNGCIGLTSISIPVSVTAIGDGAFTMCLSLTSIEYDGNTAQWYAIVKGSNWNLRTGSYVIHCTDGDISK